MTAAAGGRDLRTVLDLYLAAAQTARRYDIGYPGATDLTFPELSEWFTGQLLNNIGDPYDPGHGRNHTKHMEQQVISTLAGWLNAPAGHWGYVTGGASEGTEHALDEARQEHPDVVVYTSAAAHYSVVKAARKLRLPLVQVGVRADGQMNIDDLAIELRRRRERPAAIVATAGTTMTEAIDDIEGIVDVCDRLAVLRRRIHVDAALSGIPLALLPNGQRPAFDFASGATSMVVSGHKFLSTLMPCGVIIYAQSPYMRAGRTVAYTGTLDTTVGGSRSGHTPLILWTSLMRHGAEGHRTRAAAARELASYACEQLRNIGWPAWRNPHAFTVVLDLPPRTVRDRWVLADDGQRAHLITMPGIVREQIDEFIGDMRRATRSPGLDTSVRARGTANGDGHATGGDGRGSEPAAKDDGVLVSPTGAFRSLNPEA